MSNNKKHLKSKFIERLKENEGLIYLTASDIGIDSKTYYNWGKSDPEFKKKCKFIRRLKLDENTMRIIKLAKTGHLGALVHLDNSLRNDLTSKKENKFKEILDLPLELKIAVLKRSVTALEAEKLNLEHAG
jgi:hypothetical protein